MGHDAGMAHLSLEELTARLDPVRQAPADGGELRLIVTRPDLAQRETPDHGMLTAGDGLVGDNWKARGSRHSEDGRAEVARQITIMNARAAALVADSDDPAAWAPAGDQLYIDLDVSHRNLPAGTRLRLGAALLEITDVPHTGCGKFAARFGLDAHRFVNTDEAKALRLRGVYAAVIEDGPIAIGDRAHKVAGPDLSAVGDLAGGGRSR